MSVLRQHTYTQDAVAFDGAVATAGAGARPGVLVLHGWEGRSDGQDAFARRVADLGYTAFCVDLYGDGKRGGTPAECEALMTPLMADRALLRRRLLGAVEAVAGLADVEETRIVAMGFCFGGLCALDIARANAPVRGVASFHGVFSAPPGPPAAQIKPKVLVLHGWDDPMAPPSDVVALGAELTAAKADWQIHVYGGTMHAFMAQGANQPERGIQYNERSANRAWAAFEGFLTECFAM